MADTKSDLPPGWARTTVKDVGAVRLGRQRSPAKHSGRFPTKYLRAANISSNGLDLSDVLEMDFTPAESRVFELRLGDVVLAEASGSAAQVGRAALWGAEIPGCCYQNTVVRFRPHAAAPRYALVVFQHYMVAGIFAQAARGVGIQHLGASRFANLAFPLPPMPEQERIASVVESRRAELREAEISLRSALARIDEQTLEILAAAIAGELVETEIGVAGNESRSIELSNASQEGVDPDSGTVQPSLFAATDELPRNEWPQPTPPGWVWMRMDQAGEVALGKMREPKRHHGFNMRPYLRVANVLEDRIDITDVKSMHFDPDEVAAFELRYGDILLNEGQSPELVGRPAMFRDELPGACFQKTLLRFRVAPTIDPRFALLVFRHYLHSGKFRNVAQWSTNIAHLTRRRFAAMPFPVPPLPEQRRIAAAAYDRLGDSATQRAAVKASLDRLPDMAAELLAAAVSGELVAQDPKDEAAVDLLARLGSPPAEDIAVNLANKDTFEPAVDANLTDPEASAASSLTDVLRAAGKPMTLPDLCHAAGYDRHRTEDIERFYVQLHVELGKTIQSVGDALENKELEAVVDAA